LAAAQSVVQVVRVQVKLQERSNFTRFTDCTFAGDLNRFVTFYCGQLTGIYGDGVRILTTDSGVDFAIEEIRIYEHPGKFYSIELKFGQELNNFFLGVGCGYPGEDEDVSFQPRAEFYPIGSRVRYDCKPGTILFPAGSDVRICSNKGQWNGDVPRCVPGKLKSFKL
jgi:hypothetical protein